MPPEAPQASGTAAVPRHVAVIMDGNGRWAEQRSLPRVAGHRAGTKAVRITIEECVRAGVGALTLFAFSSENWRRPASEVGLLMQLFLESLDREVDELHANGVRIRFIGDRSRLVAALRLHVRVEEKPHGELLRQRAEHLLQGVARDVPLGGVVVVATATAAARRFIHRKAGVDHQL